MNKPVNVPEHARYTMLTTDQAFRLGIAAQHVWFTLRTPDVRRPVLMASEVWDAEGVRLGGKLQMEPRQVY